MDGAMKFLQIRYREKQSDWYGKRGLNWHISRVITKNASTGKVELTSYAHIFDLCQQDWYAVCSINHWKQTGGCKKRITPRISEGVLGVTKQAVTTTTSSWWP